MLGPGGGNIGRGKPLPEECQGSGMLEEERKTSKPPVPRGLVGLSSLVQWLIDKFYMSETSLLIDF